MGRAQGSPQNRQLPGCQGSLQMGGRTASCVSQNTRCLCWLFPILESPCPPCHSASAGNLPVSCYHPRAPGLPAVQPQVQLPTCPVDHPSPHMAPGQQTAHLDSSPIAAGQLISERLPDTWQPGHVRCAQPEHLAGIQGQPSLPRLISRMGSLCRAPLPSTQSHSFCPLLPLPICLPAGP